MFGIQETKESSCHSFNFLCIVAGKRSIEMGEVQMCLHVYVG